MKPQLFAGITLGLIIGFCGGKYISEKENLRKDQNTRTLTHLMVNSNNEIVKCNKRLEILEKRLPKPILMDVRE